MEWQGWRIFSIMFCAGLDLGQRRDYTAIAVVERRDLFQAYLPPQFHSVAVRHVERLPLGTAYPAVVERVRAVVQSPVMPGGCSLTVDATGVGQPVVDMLRAARLGCDICPVTITGGEHAQSHSSGWNVPKSDLMGGLRVLLENGALRIARDLRGARILMRELMDMRNLANGRVGAEGKGQHDDLVMALALACWRVRRMRDVAGKVRLPGM